MIIVMKLGPASGALSAAALAIALGGSSTRADTGSYALQVGGVDAVGDAAMVAGVWAQSMPLTYGGLAVFALGGPAVHGAHDHWDRAAEDLGVRVATPVATGIVAMMLCKPDDGRLDGNTCVAHGGIGIAIGMLAAEAFDGFVLAKRNDAPATPLMFTLGGHF